jgi:hypothetical protein
MVTPGVISAGPVSSGKYLIGGSGTANTAGCAHHDNRENAPQTFDLQKIG